MKQIGKLTQLLITQWDLILSRNIDIYWYMANICIQLIIKIVFLKYVIISFVIRHFNFLLTLGKKKTCSKNNPTR